MSPSQNQTELADAAARECAVATFDRNLVVTAGAGTGKTTLLVERLGHLLLRNPDPLRITEIVALTFTNKAANEMKSRLRERLQAYLTVRLDQEPESHAGRKTKGQVELLLARYQLSKDELDRRVHDALRNLERSDIGTIHSFAATLLRLYPLEAGVDPQFQEDDGQQFERLFDQQWDLWLDQELSVNAPRAETWKTVLGKVTLAHVKELAKSLSAETVELRRQTETPPTLPGTLAGWLAELEARATAIIERHPEERMNEKLVRAARAVIEEYRRGRRGQGSEGAEAKSLIADKSINRNLKGWSAEDAAQAQELTRAALGLCRVDAELTASLWNLLVPFAESFREFFVRQGYVSFDGLLVRARNLVRAEPRVRAELKRQYRSILIDEFQDTDPIQYEILLYLAETPDTSAENWRKVKLTPGKVFVVGDPKQSIYAFRRADIEAYLEVVEKIIMAQDGIECPLTTNFRSNRAILDVVNGVFARLIQAQHGVQPRYIEIEPPPDRPPAVDQKLPSVSIRKTVAVATELNAEKARRLEGESLARWLKEEILDKTVILSAGGERVYAQPKDVAILFRKLTDIHDYLESFRRRDIRYVVEGERHFYAAKEIIDAVNLFRAIENPHDPLALVGVLRSPLGGLTDRQIYELNQAGLLDYRKADALDTEKSLATLAELYRALGRLHEETRVLPVGEAFTHIFSSLPIKLLAACYFHGEQAVANLEKLRQQAVLLGREGVTTLKEAIRQLEERVLEVKEEAESVLAEENLDAVRIMSIHKAKGLEFPIVILAGCQTGTEGRSTGDAQALFDWSSGLAGLRIGQAWDLPGVYIAEKARLRAEAEQRRVFYVAMTRAREHLIVSCAPMARRMSGGFLAMLGESLSENIDTADAPKTLRAGNGSIEMQVVEEGLAAPGKDRHKAKGRKKRRDWRCFIDTWRKRRERYERALKTSPFVTPTFLKQQAEQCITSAVAGTRAQLSQTIALVIGDLAHRFLQNWDFSLDPRIYPAQLSAFFDRALPDDKAEDRNKIEAELGAIFRGFFGSPVYAELAASRILGREVPLLMPWNGQIMEGVIDLIYEREGLLYLADYKTDRISKAELAQAVERYRQQAEIYSQATRQSLKREVSAFKLIFLRLGEAVEVKASREPGELFPSTST